MQNKKKILRIANRFNIGGPTFNVAYLTRYLDNYETLLVGGALDDGEDSSNYILEDLGITPRIIPEMKREINPREDYEAYLKLREIIREFKPDIVHTHASKPGAIGRLAAIHENVPVIVHTFHGHVFHSYFGKLKTTFYKVIERYLAARSSRIIAISDGQAHELSKIHTICKPEKIQVVRLGFDLGKFNTDKEAKRLAFRTEWQLAEETVAIVIVGRLVPVKNHNFLIQAIRKLKELSSAKFQLFIVGDGEERTNIENFCTEAQLRFSATPNPESDVVFTSWIKDVDRVYAGGDVVVLTSLNEGTPVSLIEAQAAGKPIVSTNVGGIKNIVLENKTALLTSTTDIDLFAKHLKTLVEDKTLCQTMSESGWEHVKENYHYTRLVKDMDNLYQKLLSEAENS